MLAEGRRTEMAGLNLCQFIGNLGRDPELRRTDAGTAVCTLSLAATRKYYNRAKELVEDTEWIRIVVWDKRGEVCAEHLSKGSQVYVQGRMQTRKWTDDKGVDRWATDIVAESVTFLGRARGGDGRPHPAQHGDDAASSSRTARNPSEGGGGPPDMSPPPGDNDIPY